MFDVFRVVARFGFFTLYRLCFVTVFRCQNQPRDDKAATYDLRTTQNNELPSESPRQCGIPVIVNPLLGLSLTSVLELEVSFIN
jgi:hypothetical protein